MAKVILDDYYNDSLSSQLNEINDTANKIKEIKGEFEKNKNDIQEAIIRESERNKEFETKINDRLNNIESMIDILIKKNDNMFKIILKELGSIRSHIDNQFVNNNIDLQRFVNASLRTKNPIHFYASHSSNNK